MKRYLILAVKRGRMTARFCVKRYLTAILLAFWVISPVFGQLSGPLSGILPGDSTYTVIGDISVEIGDSLTIEAGAVLVFNDNTLFTISGYIYAAGIETDSIKFINNPGTWWGGIDFNNSASDNSLLEYCLITGSSSSGIYCYYASPTISNCSISGNMTTGNGGGIYCHYSSPPISNGTIIDCIILGNTADGDGGGIYCSVTSPYIENCIISGNSADDIGGGICCFSASYAFIASCTISENTAGSGGGIFCSFYSSPSVTHCTITDNTALLNNGDGISCVYHCYSSIDNCTISGNTASLNGGGIYLSDSSPNISNCILWNDSNREIYVYSGSPTITYTDIQGGWTGTGNIDDDPLFYSTTGDSAYRLTAESPCIDAGDPNSPLDPDSTIADMGAYYYHQTTGIGYFGDEVGGLRTHPTMDVSPNPFNQSSVISFELHDAGFVSLDVFDVTGREVGAFFRTPLQNTWMSAGQHSVVFDAEGLASGVYFVRLDILSNAGNPTYSMTRKMLLLK